MADAGYTVLTGAAVSITAAAHSILGIKSGAAFGLSITGAQIGFDGITATDHAVLVELCYSTFATNSVAGTANTARTPTQEYGRVLAHGCTGYAAWTSEPTVLTPIREWLITPIGGFVLYDLPLGKEPDCAFNEGFVLRCTPPTSTVNARGTLAFRRC